MRRVLSDLQIPFYPVREGVALQEVAIIEQQAEVRAISERLNQPGAKGQSEMVNRAVGEVVVGQDMHMQIRRLEYTQTQPWPWFASFIHLLRVH